MELPVREYDGTPSGRDREPVLMLRGRSVPALAGFDLAPVPGGKPTRYSWAQELAQAGFDVFIMEIRGSGRSARPGVMDDPYNADPAQQQPVLVDHTIPAPGQPSYKSELGNSESEWAELAAVVAFIKTQVGAEKRIHFAGWSAASFVMGSRCSRREDGGRERWTTPSGARRRPRHYRRPVWRTTPSAARGGPQGEW